MKRTIAVFGGSFNPPCLHHRQIAQELAGQFDSVVIVPCGPRPDKVTNDHLPPTYRAAMADVSFTGIRNVEVDLFDLEQEVFTRTHELQRRYEQRGEVWHVVGGDLICGGGKGESAIHRLWHNGHEMWKSLNFVVLSRPGVELTKDDLPPKHRFIQVSYDGTSETIREKIFHGEPLADLVPRELAGYIDRHGLYRGSIPARATRVKLDNPRLLIIPDQRNPKALELAKKLEPYSCPEDPNLIVARRRWDDAAGHSQ
jgi:NAD+ kinase